MPTESACAQPQLIISRTSVSAAPYCRPCSIKIPVTFIKDLAPPALESGMRCSAHSSLGVTAGSGYRTTPALAVIWQQPALRISIFPVRIAALALSLETSQSEPRNALAPHWLRSSSLANSPRGAVTCSDARKTIKLQVQSAGRGYLPVLAVPPQFPTITPTIPARAARPGLQPFYRKLEEAACMSKK